VEENGNNRLREAILEFGNAKVLVLSRCTYYCPPRRGARYAAMSGRFAILVLNVGAPGLAFGSIAQRSPA